MFFFTFYKFRLGEYKVKGDTPVIKKLFFFFRKKNHFLKNVQVYKISTWDISAQFDSVRISFKPHVSGDLTDHPSWCQISTGGTYC